MTHIHSLVVMLAGAALLVGGCGPAGIELPGQPRCLKVGLPDKGALTTGLPAKVSLFFTVDSCDGKAVSGLTSENFEILENGAPVSVYESQRTVQPKGQRFRMSSMVLLDLSGSMLKSGGFPALREAASTYIDQVLIGRGEGHKVAVYAFDGRPTLTPVVEFSDSPKALKDGIAALETRQCKVNADCAAFSDRRSCAGWMCVDDSTNLNGAVAMGVERLEKELELEPEIAFKEAALVVFTDGTDQAARVTAAAALKRVTGSKVHTFTVGLGGEVDMGALRALGKDGFFSASHAEELKAAFLAIAANVLSLANRFYLLEYCSPKRSGTHELKVKVTLPAQDGAEPLVGTLSKSFDAQGFESGCEISP